MGRYTQRRRAASGPSPAAAPAPPGLTIVDVQIAGLGIANITFSAIVSFTTGFISDSQFTIDGNGVNNVASIPSSPNNVVQVNVGGSPSAGSAWSLTGQPGWLIDAADVPESGICT